MLLGHEVRLHRAPRGTVEGGADTQHEREGEHPGGRDLTGEGQRRHHERRRHHRGLGAQQETAAVEEVGERAGGDPDEEDRQERGGLDERDLRRAAAQAPDEPRRGDGLHERAEIRDELRDEQCEKDAVAQRSPR